MVLFVPVDVTPIRLDLVVKGEDRLEVGPDAAYFRGLIYRNAAVRHNANHTLKPYNRSTTDRTPMQTKVLAERGGFEPPVQVLARTTV